MPPAAKTAGVFFLQIGLIGIFFLLAGILFTDGNFCIMICRADGEKGRKSGSEDTVVKVRKKRKCGCTGEYKNGNTMERTSSV